MDPVDMKEEIWEKITRAKMDFGANNPVVVLSQKEMVELKKELDKNMPVYPAEPATKQIPYTGFDDIDRFLDECFATMSAKGHDYREGNDADALHNFRTLGEELDLPMEKIWFVYFSKHLKALKTFIKEGGQKESEPIEGRIKDMIVYLLLMYKMVKEIKVNKNLDLLAAKGTHSNQGFVTGGYKPGKGW